MILNSIFVAGSATILFVLALDGALQNVSSRRGVLRALGAIAAYIMLISSYPSRPDAPTPPVSERVFILVIPDPSAPAEGILLPWDPTAPIPNMPAPHLLQG